MAAFGVPRVAEDDALRAVRAGVAMQEAFRDARRASSRGASARSACASRSTPARWSSAPTTTDVDRRPGERRGAPAAGGARRRRGARRGDAAPGRDAGDAGAARQRRAQGPRGGGGGVPRRVARAAGRRRRRRRSSAATTSWRASTAVYDAAVATPAARLAVLLGSPGLGKSRLIDEFDAPPRRRGDRRSPAHCDAAGGATFAPLAQALREFLGHRRRRRAPRRCARRSRPRCRRRRRASARASPAASPALLGGLARLARGDLLRRPPLPRRPRRGAAGGAGDRRPAVGRAAAARSGRAPGAVGQPACRSSCWSARGPSCATCARRSSTPGGLVADVVTLAGLDAGAAMRLAANVIGAADLPAAVAAKVLATSEGNPLFVGELVRMLVQEGALTKEGERWIVGAELAALEMPPTIHALLAARIERLRPEERTRARARRGGRPPLLAQRRRRAAAARRRRPRRAPRVAPAQRADRARHRLAPRRAGAALPPRADPRRRLPAPAEGHARRAARAPRRLDRGAGRRRARARRDDRLAPRAGAPAPRASSVRSTRRAPRSASAPRAVSPRPAAGRSRATTCRSRRACSAARSIGSTPTTPARADLALDWCEALLAAGDVGPAADAIDELDRVAADSPRLRAWHTCFAGQLTVLTAPRGAARDRRARWRPRPSARRARRRRRRGQGALRARAGAGAARQGRRLRGGARPGAAAARRAGDRRRANAVLAGAPLAALWGPSPVTRASGRCLDVVRVLRITQGAPAVEAVALSCQGVLEALRGRTEAARRMIASSRKMVEELGITPPPLEADVFAGRIDLLEGDARRRRARAARRLRRPARPRARHRRRARRGAARSRAAGAGPRRRGGGAVATRARLLAGDDLQAAIAWRGVRAEALARRGEHAAAVELARGRGRDRGRDRRPARPRRRAPRARRRAARRRPRRRGRRRGTPRRSSSGRRRARRCSPSGRGATTDARPPPARPRSRAEPRASVPARARQRGDGSGGRVRRRVASGARRADRRRLQRTPACASSITRRSPPTGREGALESFAACCA